MTTGKALNGKPYAGNPHVRFDEGEVASAEKPRRGSLLYTRLRLCKGMAAVALICAAAHGDTLTWVGTGGGNWSVAANWSSDGSHKSVLLPPPHVPSAAHDGNAAATQIAATETTAFQVCFLMLSNRTCGFPAYGFPLSAFPVVMAFFLSWAVERILY